jgi:hypothetical protein
VTMSGGRKDTDVDRDTLIRHLRELIDALERRMPHLEREGERRIALDAAALRQKAAERLAELER